MMCRLAFAYSLAPLVFAAVLMLPFAWKRQADAGPLESDGLGAGATVEGALVQRNSS